ncbi:hypothetical protein MJH12_02990 [bacterium]|nr:hypothetical protein [bacterium]
MQIHSNAGVSHHNLTSPKVNSNPSVEHTKSGASESLASDKSVASPAAIKNESLGKHIDFQA